MTGQSRAAYLHLPFCTRRCPYCDFATEALPRRDDARIDRYLEAVRSEISAAEPRPTTTVFFGGGTPTVVPPAGLLSLLETVDRHGGIGAGAEITCEANPTTVEAAQLGSLRRGGVNRISFGVQSFEDRLLRALGRNHDRREAIAAYEAARAAGFGNVSLDLMFNLPGQSLADWRRTLEAAIGLAPEHLSCYSLTVDEDTPLGRWVGAGRVSMPPEDLDAGQYELTMDLLGAAGYRQYEISNWARPGFECRHNLTYWYNEPYRGFGLSAASYEDDVRFANRRDFDDYLRAVEQGLEPVAEREARDWIGQQIDTMFCGLRLNEGVSIERYRRRFGVAPEETFGAEVGRLADRGLLERDAAALRLTDRGRMLANQVLLEFC